MKSISFPSKWKVDIYGSDHYESLPRNSLRKQLHLGEWQSQVQCKKNLTNGFENGIGIAVDDLTRPTPAKDILNPLIEFLNDQGVSTHEINIFIASGAHRPFQRGDVVQKIGQTAYQQCVVHHHSPFCHNEYLGKTTMKTPVYVNEYFMKMSLKIAIGTVLPHSSVGFGGGAKLIVPGLSGIETIKHLHGDFPHCKGKFAGISDNPLRKNIDEAGKLLDIDLFIQVVCNPNRSIAKIFTGEGVLPYQQAADYVREKATFPIKKNYDIGIFNAYPLDTEFLQAGKALDIMRSTENKVVREGGSVILSSAASEGHGFHHLRSPGMIAPFSGDWSKPYEGRDLIFFGENISPAMLPEETRINTQVFNRWENLLAFLKRKYTLADVAVFPYASIQIPNYTGS